MRRPKRLLGDPGEQRLANQCCSQPACGAAASGSLQSVLDSLPPPLLVANVGGSKVTGSLAAAAPLPSTAPPPVAMDALRVRSTSMLWHCASCHRPSSNSMPRNHPSISDASPNQAGAPRMVPPALRGVDASQRPWVYPMQAGKPPCRPRWSFR